MPVVAAGVSAGVVAVGGQELAGAPLFRGGKTRAVYRRAGGGDGGGRRVEDSPRQWPAVTTATTGDRLIRIFTYCVSQKICN